MSSNRRLVVVAGIAAVVLVIVLVAWLAVHAPAPAPTPAVGSPTSTTAAANGLGARLTALLPPGYPAGGCAPPADAAAAAVLMCGRNLDPGGPATATYALARSPEALQAAYQQVISESAW